MEYLLDDRFAPITSEMGFIESSVDVAVSTYFNWQKVIQSKRGVELKQKSLQGGLPELLSSLLPLTNIEHRRTLFIPTATRWTAYFDNGWQGGDPFSAVSYLSEVIGCYGIKAVCIPNSMSSDLDRAMGRQGATIFELYGPQKTDYLNVVRTVGAVCDNGRWQFSANGEPQDYEDIAKYKKRNVVDRFTPDMLKDYLSALEIDAFSEDFYITNQDSYLIYKEGPSAQNMKEYSLSEARRNY